MRLSVDRGIPFAAPRSKPLSECAGADSRAHDSPRRWISSQSAMRRAREQTDKPTNGSEMRINGNAALVIGGTSGLGEAIARELSARGADVVIGGRNSQRGESLCRELGVRFVPMDITRAADVARAVGTAKPLRISLQCAGIPWGQRLVSRRGPHELDSFERVVAVNLIGTFNALRLAAHAMLATEPTETGERGVIINTASVAYCEGRTGQIAYSASKGGVAAMTLPAARDLAGSGVRICTIAPGAFDTPMFATLDPSARESMAAQVPFPARLGRPQEYAALACHIVENEMLNGEVIRLDGALRLAAR
jgi:NAD(P)-dependent dehydrogenase (short-subunit alcohol dehydrogenase family)